ncbi:MAG: family finger-like protein, partial [Solirubrobacterales bacterium]|nr:family finger-like protein [Solirubrobacterales bacterium]
ARAAAMRGVNPAFGRAADAISALAYRIADAFAAAVEAIVGDFEQRSEHLTGVAVADTALMLDELARRRGVAVAVGDRDRRALGGQSPRDRRADTGTRARDQRDPSVQAPHQ